MVSSLTRNKEVIHGFLEMWFTNLRTGDVVEVSQAVQETVDAPMYITIPICPATDKVAVGDPVHVQVHLDGMPHLSCGGVLQDYDFPNTFAIRLKVQMSEVV